MTHVYQAAHTSAVFCVLTERRTLRLTGRNRVDLVNRMSTNKLTDLAPGQGAQTVLTTPIGRVIDLLVFLVLDDAVLLITSDGRGDAIETYLRRNIFFNDQVTVENMGADQMLLAVYGPQSRTMLGLEADLALFSHVVSDDMRIVAVPPLGGGGYWLAGTHEQLTNVETRLRAEGAQLLDADTLALLQIEAGYPAPGHELTEDYIPLELGLWPAVSFNKGCYTGQEVIARLESRGQLAKMLLRLHTEAALAPGDALLAEGKSVGQITRIAAHPDGGYVALGVVKTAAVDLGQALSSPAGEPVTMVGIAGHQPRRT
ncbi:MAG: YgfZ/GcvT domain-containing protein [Anaerolineales bacterium]